MLFVLLAYLTRRNTGYIAAIVYLTTVSLCQYHGWFPQFADDHLLNAMLLLLWLEGYAGVLGSIGNDFAEGSFYHAFIDEPLTTRIVIILIHVAAIAALTIPWLMVLFTLAFFALIIGRCLTEPELRHELRRNLRLS